MANVAIYPGSFDPLTNGHIGVIDRGLKVFDQIIVAVALNVRKRAPLFSVGERLKHIKTQYPGDEVEVDTFEGLLVEYAASRGSNVILRGLRAVSDFEYEMQMTHMNRRLNDDVETVFVMTEEDQSFLSSSLVKEVASFGGDISQFVPAHVAEPLYEKLQND